MRIHVFFNSLDDCILQNLRRPILTCPRFTGIQTEATRWTIDSFVRGKGIAEEQRPWNLSIVPLPLAQKTQFIFFPQRSC